VYAYSLDYITQNSLFIARLSTSNSNPAQVIHRDNDSP